MTMLEMKMQWVQWWRKVELLRITIMRSVYVESTLIRVRWEYCDPYTLRVLWSVYVESTVIRVRWEYFNPCMLRVLWSVYVESTVIRERWEYCHVLINNCIIIIIKKYYYENKKRSPQWEKKKTTTILPLLKQLNKHLHSRKQKINSFEKQPTVVSSLAVTQRTSHKLGNRRTFPCTNVNKQAGN